MCPAALFSPNLLLRHWSTGEHDSLAPRRIPSVPPLSARPRARAVCRAGPSRHRRWTATPTGTPSVTRSSPTPWTSACPTAPPTTTCAASSTAPAGGSVTAAWTRSGALWTCKPPTEGTGRGARDGGRGGRRHGMLWTGEGYRCHRVKAAGGGERSPRRARASFIH